LDENHTRQRPRLYLITPPRVDDPADFVGSVMRCLDAGDVACVQIRLKTGEALDEPATRELATLLIGPVQDRGVAVVMNDSPQLAHELGADGVHLGPLDMDVKSARSLLGSDAIIGYSAKASRHAAMEAGEAGADYVAFGAFYPTTTKAGATPADPDLLRLWQEQMEIPCVAIGGITVANALPLLEAGADFLAVSSGVWQAPEGPEAAVAALNALMDQFGSL
jgi:thiamine-phosphate pyrophosphorylase